MDELAMALVPRAAVRGTTLWPVRRVDVPVATDYLDRYAGTRRAAP